jgi:hypothetical protein
LYGIRCRIYLSTNKPGTLLFLGAVLEPIVIIVATFSGCLLSYEIVRRVPLLRPLFGLKSQSPVAGTTGYPVWGGRVRGVLAALIVVLTGFEILM